MKFLTQKRFYIICITAATIIFASTLSYITYSLGADKAARGALEAETARLQSDTAVIEGKNEELQGRADELDEELVSKDELNRSYLEYRNARDALMLEIEELKTQSEQLDSDIETKRAEAESSQGHGEVTTGKSYALKKGETYSCPDKIPAGRYIAKGSGTFTVINSASATRVSSSLDVAYDHSYTFDLYEKEKVKVTGDVTLTEIKSQ